MEGVSTGTVTEVASAFRSMGKTVNKVGTCGQQGTLDDCDAQALVRYPRVRGSGGSVIYWGAFCWHGLGPFVTAYQYLSSPE